MRLFLLRLIRLTKYMDGAITELARAKVNLTLHVGAAITAGNWTGYHPVESLVVFADFGDVLNFEPAEQNRVSYTGTFSENFIDVDEGQNSMIKTLVLCGVNEAMDIRLEKNIPIAAGLGGGTADAAAVLRVFDPKQKNHPIVIGADGPVCHLSQTAMMEGIGEIVTPQPELGRLSAVLVNPGVSVSTGEIFKAMDSTPRPETPKLTARRGDLLSRALSGENDMQDAAIVQAPVISDVLRLLAQQTGCELARMSGSGATCFGIFRSDAQARAAVDAIMSVQSGWWCRACRLGDRPEDTA